MDFEQMIELIDHVSASELSSFHYENGDTKISMKAEKTVVMSAQPDTETIQSQNVSAENKNVQQVEYTEPEGKIIKSPLVGTFYVAPAEDAPAFVNVGDTVKKGQVIAIVEAMKLMNDIESEFDGKIAEIYVKNGEAVEYGQPLFCVE